MLHSHHAPRYSLSVGRGFFVLIGIALSVALGHAYADEPRASDLAERWGFAPTQISPGIAVTTGICPCIRWSVSIRAASGQWENQNFIISSSGLAQLRVQAEADFQRSTAQIFQAGAIEVLSKQGHIGIGFDGVEIGQDTDAGTTEMLRTGFYALINALLETDPSHESAMRLDLRAGWSTPGYRINRGERLRRQQFRESLIFDWQKERWSGGLMANIGLDLTHLNEGSIVSFEAGARARFEILRLGTPSVGINLGVFGGRDPFRALLGLVPETVGARVFFDVAWVNPARVNQGGDPGIWRWW